MNRKIPIVGSALALALAFQVALAGHSGTDAQARKSVIALKGGDFELAETDISHLGIGDAETIYTEDGRTIDILRTEEGIELYVDGELLEVGPLGNHDGHHVVEKRVEVICADDEGEGCETYAWVSDGEDLDLDALHEAGHEAKVIVVKERSGID